MTPLLITAGWTLIHFVWQGCALAAIVAVALRLVERRAANVRYAIACGGLAALLAAPAATFRLLSAEATTGAVGVASHGAQTGERTRGPRAAVANGWTPIDQERDGRSARGSLLLVFEQASTSLNRVAPFVAIVWLVGVGLLLARMAGGWWRVRRLHRRALASAPSTWQTSCRRLAHCLGLTAAAHVVESSLVDVPTLVGWLRPVIMLPVAAIAVMSPAQVDAILAHELAHIRRHDYAVNILQTIAETLLFYHPAVWWISTRIREEREHCCDDVAVRACGDRVGYARALAELETWRSARTRMAMAATGGSLLDRVRRILQAPPADEPRSPSWAITLALTLIFTAGAGGVQQLPWFKSHTDTRVAWAAEPPIELMQDRPSTPTAPAPPAPPAAPAPRDYTTHMAWSAGGSQFDMTLHGDVVFTDDLTDVVRMSPGSYLKIRDWSHLIPRTVEIRSTGDTVTRTYYVGGVRRGWDDESRRWLASELPALVRRSGLGADARVRSILEKKGIAGVLDEIALLGGDYARRLYLIALVDEAHLDAAGVLPVLEQVGRRMSSAYEQRQVLQHVAANVKLDQRASIAYAQAIGSMTSDYEERQALRALLAGGSPAIDGDAVMTASAHIDSSYEKRMVLTDAIQNLPLTPTAKHALLTTAATIQSDYERSQVLQAYVGKFGVEPEARETFFAALQSMHSDYERRRVLNGVARRGPLSPEVLQGAVRAVSAMSSDHERAEALLALLHAQQGAIAAGRPVFVAAAERIGSSYEQNRVLAALVKSDAR